MRGVDFRIWISPRTRSQNRNGLKGGVRDLGKSDLCKNIKKTGSLSCPFKKKTPTCENPFFFARPQVTCPYRSELCKNIRSRISYAWAPLTGKIPLQTDRRNRNLCAKEGLTNVLFTVLYSIALHMSPNMHIPSCVEGWHWWGWTQDCCDFSIGSHIRSNHSVRSHPCICRELPAIPVFL